MPTPSTAAKTDWPDPLRPMVFHGLDLTPAPVSGSEHRGTCFACGKAKLYVNRETGQYSCKVCGETGNPTTFLRRLWELSFGDPGRVDLGADGVFYGSLAKSRLLLRPDSLRAFGVAPSAADGHPLIPAYDRPNNKPCTLVSYRPGAGGKFQTMITPTTRHGLFVPQDYSGNKPAVYVCEGPWDACALREVLVSLKKGDDGRLVPTGSPESSLYAGADVVAVPSASVFYGSWSAGWGGKEVVLLYDSDHTVHPVTKALSSAGYDGMRRAAGVMAGMTEPPASIRYVEWGPAGYDPDRPSGWDVRDELSKRREAVGPEGGPVPLRERGERLLGLLAKVKPVPADWLPGRSAAAVRSGSPAVAPLDCSQWRALDAAWRKAMKWTDGLDRALSVMLASCCSVPVPGDQLWVRVISPPSTGKSVLCEALAVASRYVMAKSTLTGFHSGYDDGTEANHSPLIKMRDKTLVIKDGDTILTAPERDRVLAEARDVYDRVSRSTYRNGKGMDHEALNLTVILCGTSSLRELDTSELGERFLTCTIMDRVDPVLEKEIQRRSLRGMFATIAVEDRPEGAVNGESADMLRAKRLTAGYVEHLRSPDGQAAVRRAAAGVDDGVAGRIESYARLVAYLRARPSKKQTELVQREMASRLTNQMGRLSVCLAAVLNRTGVDDEVVRRVRAVALDSCRGVTFDLAEHLAGAGPGGCEFRELHLVSNRPEPEVRALLRFLRGVGVVDQFTPESAPGRKAGVRRYRLTDDLAGLWKETVETS